MLNVRRLGFALGAEITGLDLTRPIDDGTIAELRSLWLEHIVLCFRATDLTPKEQMTFCSRFGELDDNRARPNINHPEFPHVSIIASRPIAIEEKKLISVKADSWHSDGSYTDRPGVANFLLAQELPPVGGDTLFSNMYMAYDTLSEGMKGLLDGLEGIHDVGLSPYQKGLEEESRHTRRGAMQLAVHPVVRVHPETGRKSLYVGAFLRGFAGMTEDESRPLIDFLNDHATRYEFTYRHRWSLYDLVVWDNRCAMHYAVSDYDPNEMRRMQRCMLDPPVSGRILAVV